VRLDGVRLVVSPAFFRLPKLRRYRGYALFRTILLRDEPTPGRSDDLITHEVCHIWQGQHRKLHMLFTYATTRYRQNPYEREARWAVAATRAAQATAPSENATGTASATAPSATSQTGSVPDTPSSS
jgi:hypothetical protein